MAESFRDLRLFVAAFEERSFTAAAEREHATQSGISQHVQKLEARFGAPLFTRDRGRIEPTPAAEAFYRRSVELLRLHYAALSEVGGFVGGLSGRVNVGLAPTLTSGALAPALSRFTALHPNVAVRVTEAYSPILIGQVRRGELDFAVTPAPQEAEGLRAKPFARTLEVLISSPSLGFTPKAPMRLTEQAPLKVVLPSLANARTPALRAYFAAQRVPIAAIVELDAMMGTLDYVARTDWVSAVPGLMMSDGLACGRLIVNPIIDPVLPVELMVIEPARRPLSLAADAFLALLSEEAETLNAPWRQYLAHQPE